MLKSLCDCAAVASSWMDKNVVTCSIVSVGRFCIFLDCDDYIVYMKNAIYSHKLRIRSL